MKIKKTGLLVGVSLLILSGCSNNSSAPSSPPQVQVENLSSLSFGDSDNGLVNSRVFDSSFSANPSVTINLQIQTASPISVHLISVNSPIGLVGSGSCMRSYNSNDSCSFQALVPNTTPAGNYIIRVLTSSSSAFFSIQIPPPGIVSSNGNMSADTTSLDFGNFSGNQYASRVVTLSNSSSSPVMGVVVSVADPTFSVSGNTCSIIAAHGSCIFRVGFSSLLKLPNSYNSQVNILATGLSPISIPLTAAVQSQTGLSATLMSNLSSLDYGTLNFNVASPLKIIRVTNNGPSRIANVQVTPPAGFQVVGGSCQNSALLINQSCTIIVIEITSVGGTNSGNLIVVGTNPSAQVSVALTGIVNSLVCPSGQHAGGASCVSNIQACVISNGVGSQSWNGSSFDACLAISCNSGFTLNAGSCQASNPPTQVTLTKTGNSDGDIFLGSTNVCASGQTTCTFMVPQGVNSILTQTTNSTSYFNGWNSASPSGLTCGNYYGGESQGQQSENFFILSSCTLNPSDATAITLNPDFEITPPITITELAIDYYTFTSFRVYWATNIPTTSQAFYALYPSTTYVSTDLDSTLKTSHEVQVIGKSNSQYYYFYGQSSFQGQTVAATHSSFSTLRGNGFDVYILSHGTGNSSVTYSGGNTAQNSLFGTYNSTFSLANFTSGFPLTQFTCMDTSSYCIYGLRSDGSSVTFTVTPDSGAVFNSWTSGPCAGSTNPVCTINTPTTTTSATYLEMDVQIDKSP